MYGHGLWWMDGAIELWLLILHSSSSSSNYINKGLMSSSRGFIRLFCACCSIDYAFDFYLRRCRCTCAPLQTKEYMLKCWRTQFSVRLLSHNNCTKYRLECEMGAGSAFNSQFSLSSLTSSLNIIYNSTTLNNYFEATLFMLCHLVSGNAAVLKSINEKCHPKKMRTNAARKEQQQIETWFWAVQCTHWSVAARIRLLLTV